MTTDRTDTTWIDHDLAVNAKTAYDHLQDAGGGITGITEDYLDRLTSDQLEALIEAEKLVQLAARILETAMGVN